MKSNLQAIRTFVAVADTGGFRHAADVLCLSPGAVSHHVAALEAELGVTLMKRTTRRVELTPTGMKYFQQCRRLLAELDEVTESAKAAFEAPSGQLRVSASTTFGRFVVAPALMDFVKQNPAIEVDLTLQGRHVDLRAENYDLAIRIGEPRGGEPLMMRELPRIRRLLCAAPSYLSASGVPQTPKELESHSCVIQNHRPQDQAWRLLDDSGRESVAFVGGRFAVSDTTVMLDAALDGLGIIAVAEWMVREHLASGRLVRVLPSHKPPEAPLMAVYRPDAHMCLKVRSCIDFLAKRITSALSS